jgi:hypothetical protein
VCKKTAASIHRANANEKQNAMPNRAKYGKEKKKKKKQRRPPRNITAPLANLTHEIDKNWSK